MPRRAGAIGLSAPCRGSPSLCWQDHSPRDAGGQETHLGRERIGKNCNREGNLCKAKPSENAGSAMAAGTRVPKDLVGTPGGA